MYCVFMGLHWQVHTLSFPEPYLPSPCNDSVLPTHGHLRRPRMSASGRQHSRLPLVGERLIKDDQHCHWRLHINDVEPASNTSSIQQGQNGYKGDFLLRLEV